MFASFGPTLCSSCAIRLTSAYARLGSRSWLSTPFQYVSCPAWIECQCQYSTMFAPLETFVYTFSRSCPSYGGNCSAESHPSVCAFVSVTR
jgi:hypothetical protein